MEDGAADKLPRERRKTRKRRKNGRQVYHFRTRRQGTTSASAKAEIREGRRPSTPPASGGREEGEEEEEECVGEPKKLHL